MKQLIQEILIYVILVSALKGLISNPKYGQYFRFVSGVTMVLLMLSPLLSIFDYENEWYTILEEKVLQMDLGEIQGEMEIADEKFAGMVKQEYEQIAARQVQVLAQEAGVAVEEATVEIVQENGEWRMEAVTVVTKEFSDKEQKGGAFAIETIRIGEDKRVRIEDDSQSANSLRQQICSYFVIGEDKVHIWK